jgi:hypothetical protein
MKLRVLVVVCLALPGCLDTDAGGGSTVVPTVVALQPQEFLGDLPCATGPGSIQTYVATFRDITPIADTDAAAAFELPSSPPTSCLQTVGTALAVRGHQYTADVAAYDTADIDPLAPGSPIMIRRTTREVVPPRWHGACETPVTSVEFITQYLRGCSTLAPVP